MKKRLLSAALALAMVLTMLPLSALPAFAADPVANDLKGDGTESVTYQATPDGKNYPTKGWYVTFQRKETDPSTSKEVTKTYYVKVDDGVAVSGKYYNTTNYNDTTGTTDATTNKTVYKGIYNVNATTSAVTLKSTTIQVIGGTIEIDAHGATSLSVDVYSGTTTIKESGSQNADGSTTKKLANINVTNSKKDDATAKVSFDSSVSTISSSDDKRAMRITLSGVTSDSAISWAGANVSRSLTLNNATIGAVTMSGVLTGDQTKQAGQSVTVNNKSASYTNIDNGIGAITLTGNGSKIVLGDVKGTPPAVELKGTGTSLTLNGITEVGAVTLQGAVAADITGTSTSAAPPSVTINKGTKAASIGLVTGHDADKEKSTGSYVVKVYGEVTGAVNLPVKCDIDVGDTSTGAKTGDITINSGTIDLNGSYGTVGNVSMTKNATFTLNSSNAKNYTVGAMAVASGGDKLTCTFNVPNEPSNTLTSATGYTKPTILGGTWSTAPEAAALKDLVYELVKDSKHTFYTGAQLGEALTAQGNSSTVSLYLVGKTTATRTITFTNGSVTYGVLKMDGAGSITLPAEVGGARVSQWSDTKFITDSGKDYSVPATGNVTLDAQGSLAGTIVTRLGSVTMEKHTTDANYVESDITAQVVGNVITLSGAVTAGQHQYRLTFETDAVEESGDKEVPVTFEVYVDYNTATGKLTFANTNTADLGNGVRQEGFDAIVLNNGTRYTLNGSGLKVSATELKIPKAGSNGEITGYTYIDVIVTASGYTTPEAKEAVAALVGGTGCAFDWTNSPALMKAINAVQAGITDKNLEDWIVAANRKAWTDNTRQSYDKDLAAKINYDQVWLVPYLKITVTDYKPNGSITMSMVPSYRIEVRKSTPGTSMPYGNYKVKVNGVEQDYYSPNNGGALNLTSTDLTGTGTGQDGVEVTFKGLAAATFKYMHQDGTYVYTTDSQKFTISYAGSNGLGTVVINNTQAPITLYDDAGKSNTLGTFDTLQAAVDASEDDNYIEVNPGYKSSETISVTGKPRTIKIKTSTALTVSNASGGLVEVDKNGGNNTYTIQLTREVLTVDTASISVGSANNGTASVNTTVAKPGASVSGTYKANSGYKAGSFSATAQPGNKTVGVNVSANGTFNFTVPSGATSVTVTPSFVLDNGLPFTDVANNAWYFTAVKYCYDTTNNGYRLMEGDSAATFAPNGSFTRAHMVQILWNMKGRPTPKTTANPFRDMSSSNWYYSAVLWAYENGYAKGYPDGTFKPGQAVTRQEMVQFLYQASGSRSGSGNLSYYSDGYTANNWAQPALRWATGLGILSGQNSASLGNTLAPRAVAKRCEVAVTVMNFDKLNLF